MDPFFSLIWTRAEGHGRCTTDRGLSDGPSTYTSDTNIRSVPARNVIVYDRSGSGDWGWWRPESRGLYPPCRVRGLSKGGVWGLRGTKETDTPSDEWSLTYKGPHYGSINHRHFFRSREGQGTVPPGVHTRRTKDLQVRHSDPGWSTPDEGTKSNIGTRQSEDEGP